MKLYIKKIIMIFSIKNDYSSPDLLKCLKESNHEK